MKWTLVTGGAKNLGAALCLSLAEKGHSIVVHYNQSHRAAHEIVNQCKEKGVEAEAIQGNFASIDGVKEFLKRYQQQFPDTDLLINNVGDYLIRSAMQTHIEEWLKMFQLNLHTPFILSRALIPSLIKRQGQIINIGVAGLTKNSANTYSTAYFLAKDSLWGLTRSLARELAPQHVRVNMVSPGQLKISIDTHQVPMQRPAHCWEVCRVVNFLVDPKSSYITGQNIEVAGGLGLA